MRILTLKLSCATSMTQMLPCIFSQVAPLCCFQVYEVLNVPFLNLQKAAVSLDFRSESKSI